MPPNDPIRVVDKGSVGRAVVSASDQGATEVVAAIAGRSIRVTTCTLVVAGAVSVNFSSGTADITGAMPLAANGGFSTDYCPDGHFETALGEALNIELSDAVAVGGWLVYELH